jgi:hypothetical protein
MTSGGHNAPGQLLLLSNVVELFAAGMMKFDTCLITDMVWKDGYAASL